MLLLKTCYCWVAIKLFAAGEQTYVEEYYEIGSYSGYGFTNVSFHLFK